MSVKLLNGRMPGSNEATSINCNDMSRDCIVSSLLYLQSILPEKEHLNSIVNDSNTRVAQYATHILCTLNNIVEQTQRNHAITRKVLQAMQEEPAINYALAERV